MSGVTKVAIKLLEKAAYDYEQIDMLELDSALNPKNKAKNDARVAELEKEANAISKTFGYWPE